MSLELMTAAASAPRMTHCASERSPLLCPPICNDMSCLLALQGLQLHVVVLVRRLDHLHPGPPYDGRRGARQLHLAAQHLGAAEHLDGAGAAGGGGAPR